MGANGDKRARHQAIRKLIRERMIGTQDDLVRLLAAEGFQVTQATLSRDLAQLRATRIPRPEEEGGPFYELHEPEEVPADFARLRELGVLVRGIGDNEALVVVRTMPGAAPAVALAVDEARLGECLGTIAGDDTIFVTPRRGTTTRRLTRRLQELLLQGART
jgi:transcriptional regulator of arginine metabolism